ncbi:MAG: hypothetical protein MI723_10210, partial [Caulobacterales bacterium]|nr:hypothetical protein [Caulobacterales bacterium]
MNDDRFTIHSWSRDAQDGALVFDFTCGRRGPLQERLHVTPDASRSARLEEPGAGELLGLLQAAIAATYAGSAHEIVFDDPPRAPASRRLVEALFRARRGAIDASRPETGRVEPRLVYPDDGSTSALGGLVGADSGRAPRAVLAFDGGMHAHAAAALLAETDIDTDLVDVAIGEDAGGAALGAAGQRVRLFRRVPDARARVAAGPAERGRDEVIALLVLAVFAYLT